MKEDIIIIGTGPITNIVATAVLGSTCTVVENAATFNPEPEPEPIPFLINACIGDLLTPYKSIINKKPYTKNAPRFKGKR